MDPNQFLKHSLLFDLETGKNGEIYKIGAVFHDHAFEKKGKFSVSAALEELGRFAHGADTILGHNLIGHDLPLLRSRFPDTGFLKLPVIDTLYLSPLAFPKNPYHRLVKDYKLVRDSLNDPVADARLAASVFHDQWRAFVRCQEKETDLLSFYRFCVDQCSNAGHMGDTQGLSMVFEALGAKTEIDVEQASAVFHTHARGEVCPAQAEKILHEYLRPPAAAPVLAYCLAWLRVAGGNSVIPPWVRHRFPAVPEVIRQLRETPCGDSGCAYCSRTHDPLSYLKRYFGYDTFRSDEQGNSLQREIVTRGMQGASLLAILATGGGKSLCFQLPAIVRNIRRGVLTVVLSPLQSLMKDQVDNLSDKTGAIGVAAIYGMLTPPERGDILERVKLGDIAILYIAPEQLRNSSVIQALDQREIGCWVFDEAHCLSKWGHDFRTDYLYVSRFIAEYSERQKVAPAPVACFTATAKEDVIREITDHFKEKLGIETKLFRGSIERENLSFEVREVNGARKNEEIHGLLQQRPDRKKSAALVYASRRKKTEELASYLLARGHNAKPFHAGLPAPDKRRIIEEFVSGNIDVICATNAFGMGIDKDNVRLVIHADIPGSLENYIQEAGRAGRDFRDAKCVLLYDENDIEEQFRMSRRSELTRKDIAQILRALRRAGKAGGGEVIITPGELIRDEEMDLSFVAETAETYERGADTKVKTAVSWLERAGFIERNKNQTHVFTGEPQFRTMAEAEKKIASLHLSARNREIWRNIYHCMLNAPSAGGVTSDDIASRVFSADRREEPENNAKPNLTHGQMVLRILDEMTRAGMIKSGIQLSAFVKPKGKNSSRARFKRITALETAMIGRLIEEMPEAEEERWYPLDLSRVNQALRDEEYDSNPETLRNLLKTLQRDGKGVIGRVGSLLLMQSGRGRYKAKLQRGWSSIKEIVSRRHKVSSVILDLLIRKLPKSIPEESAPVVEFSLDELTDAISNDIELRGLITDPLGAIDMSLLYLHDQKIITLQNGLAVFRQAMRIKLAPEMKGKGYNKGNFKPLETHYSERIFQVHVMNEYARLGIEKIGQSLLMVLDYFNLNKKTFINRYFPKNRQMLDLATCQNTHKRIVEDLNNTAQQSIVTGGAHANTLILAGPGSGKTRVIVHRCAYLLNVERVDPGTILVICFNHNSAVLLRRRLNDLVAKNAGGVTIVTYHAMAMILTGASFTRMAETGKGDSIDFDRVIANAVALLKGEKEVAGLEPDEQRERLLAGYQHILIDEYQDIDQLQYDMVSAIVGRQQTDPDLKLTILAVGDDDQNIYTFRGANVEFIRRFRQDYTNVFHRGKGKKTYPVVIHHLVENYRSTGHIVDAANSLISQNSDRMKRDRPGRVNKKRAGEPAGGRWDTLDPVSRGRVQILAIDSLQDQPFAIIDEIERLKSYDPEIEWQEFAVLSRTRAELMSVRALCGEREIPVCWTLAGDTMPMLHKIREPALLLERLQERRNEWAKASDLLELVDNIAHHSATLIKMRIV